MSANVLVAEVSRVREGFLKLEKAVESDPTKKLRVRFEETPFAVMREYGIPTEKMHPALGVTLPRLMKSRGAPEVVLEATPFSKCWWCETGLETALVLVGGVAACAAAILLAPEILAASPFILAAAAFAGIEAATAATIFLAVIATVGAIALVVFNSFVEAICKKMKAC